MEDTNKENKVRLISSDGGQLTVSIQVAMMSSLIAGMIDNDASEDSDDENDIPVVPLTRIKFNVLKKVFEFCVHHIRFEEMPTRTLPRPFFSLNLKDLVPEWYANFVLEITTKEFCDLMVAADYLHIKPLIVLLCLTICIVNQGKTPEEFGRLLFGMDHLPSGEDAQPEVDVARRLNASDSNVEVPVEKRKSPPELHVLAAAKSLKGENFRGKTIKLAESFLSLGENNTKQRKVVAKSSNAVTWCLNAEEANVEVPPVENRKSPPELNVLTASKPMASPRLRKVEIFHANKKRYKKETIENARSFLDMGHRLSTGSVKIKKARGSATISMTIKKARSFLDFGYETSTGV